MHELDKLIVRLSAQIVTLTAQLADSRTYNDELKAKLAEYEQQVQTPAVQKE
jgi:hypothetical protein